MRIQLLVYFLLVLKEENQEGKVKTKLHLIFSNTYQVTVRLRSQNQGTRVLIFFINQESSLYILYLYIGIILKLNIAVELIWATVV